MSISSLITSEAQSFIQEHAQTDVSNLLLQAPPVPAGCSLKELALQIAGRQSLKSKIPHWYDQSGVLVPDTIAVQQCSSQTSAIYKSNLISGDTGIDLTGGLGVDSYYLSQRFKRFIYVEQDARRAAFAAHNFSVLGAHNIEVIQGEAQEFLEGYRDKVDGIFVDPARRKNHQKVFKLEDCEPDLTQLLPLLRTKTARLLIKLSPMLDLDHAISNIAGVMEVHIVSVQNDCKELLLLAGSKNNEIKIKTVNFATGGIQSFDFHWKTRKMPSVEFSAPLKYLYEPNVSVLKAGAFNIVAQRYSISKLAINTHLYTSNKLIEDFPGRRFKINWVSPYKKQPIKKLLISDKANITTRNFPHSVAEVRKKLSLKDGGEDYLFACRDHHNAAVVIACHRM